MTIRNLEHLLEPRSVALVGASCRPGSLGKVMAENLSRAGFSGPVFFVNPKHQALLGQPVYPNIASLPTSPDLAVLVPPARAVPGITEGLGRQATRAAIVITAGVGTSIEGQRLPLAALAAAQPHCLRILGPNCLGLISPAIGLN